MGKNRVLSRISTTVHLSPKRDSLSNIFGTMVHDKIVEKITYFGNQYENYHALKNYDEKNADFFPVCIK